MKYEELIGRIFGYRVNVDEDEPLFVVAKVKPWPKGMEGGPGEAWVTAFSEMVPHGEDGSVYASFLTAEIEPLLSYAACHWFEDGIDLSRIAEKFPIVEFQIKAA